MREQDVLSVFGQTMIVTWSDHWESTSTEPAGLPEPDDPGSLLTSWPLLSWLWSRSFMSPQLSYWLIRRTLIISLIDWWQWQMAVGQTNSQMSCLSEDQSPLTINNPLISSGFLAGSTSQQSHSVHGHRAPHGEPVVVNLVLVSSGTCSVRRTCSKILFDV